MQDSDYKNSWENRKCKQESESKRSSKQSSSVSVPGKKTKMRSSLDFPDEDYIIFCLREDGSIRRKSEKPEDSDHANTDSNTEEKFRQSSHDHKSDVKEIRNSTTNEGEPMTCNKKVKSKPTPCVLKNERTVTEAEKQEEVSAPEPRNSDGSSSSFSFPVLSWKENESPPQMPKPENLNFWKQKKWGVLCLCKRF